MTELTVSNQSSSKPILYTFRRCPYAMRARLAIESSEIAVEYREILLKNKPEEMLNVSPKGTVPVLIDSDGRIDSDGQTESNGQVDSKGMVDGIVIDESLDIMFWALKKYDPLQLLNKETITDAKKLITTNDVIFKPKLDLYKYATRFPEKSLLDYRKDCLFFLEELNNNLKQHDYLLSEKISIADIAIFPFIRQFAFVDKVWFDSTSYIDLQKWLSRNLESTLFEEIMIKREIWNQYS